MEKNSTFKNFVISILLVFTMILGKFFPDLGSGNLNLFLILGAILLIIDIILLRTRRETVYMILFIIFLITIGSFSPLSTSLSKNIVSGIKIIVNFNLMLLASRYLDKKNLSKISSYFCIIIFTLTTVALINKTQYFWVLNDVVNRFSLVRLKLLYDEPSMLGYITSIFILIELAYSLKYGFNRYRSLKIFIFGIILVLSSSLNSIVVLLISIMIMVLLDNYRALRKGKIKHYLATLAPLSIVILLLTFLFDTPITQRIFSVIQGSDSSFNSRVSLSISTLPNLLSVTNFIGTSLGNLNTELSLTYIPYIYSNSFMYFIVETGVIGLIFLLVLISYIYTKALKTNFLVLTIPIFIYLILYQFGGGYFNDPWNWLFYGIVITDYSIKRGIL